MTDFLHYGDDYSEDNAAANFAASSEDITDAVPANYTGKLSAEAIAEAKAANIAQGITELRNEGLVGHKATKQAQLKFK